MYVRPLIAADPPIIPRDRLQFFIRDVYHNFGELYVHHRKLVDQLHQMQREEHPNIQSVAWLLQDVIASSRNSYIKYVSNFPIAEYTIEEEMTKNSSFKSFCDVSILLRYFQTYIDFFLITESRPMAPRRTWFGYDCFHQKACLPITSVRVVAETYLGNDSHRASRPTYNSRNASRH